MLKRWTASRPSSATVGFADLPHQHGGTRKLGYLQAPIVVPIGQPSWRRRSAPHQAQWYRSAGDACRRPHPQRRHAGHADRGLARVIGASSRPQRIRLPDLVHNQTGRRWDIATRLFNASNMVSRWSKRTMTFCALARSRCSRKTVAWAPRTALPHPH